MIIRWETNPLDKKYTQRISFPTDFRCIINMSNIGLLPDALYDSTSYIRHKIIYHFIINIKLYSSKTM